MEAFNIIGISYTQYMAQYNLSVHLSIMFIILCIDMSNNLMLKVYVLELSYWGIRNLRS
jgi:hypothetical protein